MLSICWCVTSGAACCSNKLQLVVTLGIQNIHCWLWCMLLIAWYNSEQICQLDPVASHSTLTEDLHSGVTYQRQPRQMLGGPRAPKGPTKMVYQICERLVNIECKTLKRVVFTSDIQAWTWNVFQKTTTRYLCWKRALGGRPLFDSNWNETGTGNFGNIAKDLSALATVTAMRQI